MTLDSTWGLGAIALVCVASLAVGALGLRLSRTTSDFYVAGRTVSAPLNASAIGGEYLSAASFLGVAGLVYSLGTDLLWLPVGYTVGYLVLLVLVAAPLRRSGAYTIPDFAELRLQSPRVRRLASLLVVAIGWLYLLPQFQGAGLALRTVTGGSPAVGTLVVAAVVLASVAAGGMRSITFVQAMQYWLKLVAIAVPVFVLAWVWVRDGGPLPSVTDPGGPFAGALGPDERNHPVYATYSTILALCLGTMGLPHVLVRFYTNPDGRAARRTTVFVIALLGLFYLFPPVYGLLARTYLPTLPEGTRADSVVLLLPSAITPGTLGDLLSAVLAGGAFAAFISTASGLTVSVAGVIDQDLLAARVSRWSGGDLPRTQSFRAASVVAVLVPYAAASLLSPTVALADTVGLAFAIAASTLCPLLVLGLWWRRLSVSGAVSGMLVGGVLSSTAAGVTFFGVVPRDSDSWWPTLLAQPAAWSVPIAFSVMVVGSLATARSVPRDAGRILVRLHAPEEVTGPPGRAAGG